MIQRRRKSHSQTCNQLATDCISRQAAIDAIGEKSDEIYKTKQKGATYPHDDFFQGMAYAENVVNHLPSAQPETDNFCTDCKEYDQERHFCPRFDRVIKKTVEEMKAEQRWIPVTERLPEKSGRYYVTRGLNAAGALWNRVYILNYSDLMGICNHRIWWTGNVGKCDFERIDDVLAWMPLPEAYKERREK